jgi:hypothetical protein
MNEVEVWLLKVEEVEGAERGVAYMQGESRCLIACTSALESALACSNSRSFPLLFHSHLNESNPISGKQLR